MVNTLRVLVLVTLALAGCEDNPRAAIVTDTSSTAPETQETQAALPPQNDDTLSFERSRTFDFADDGSPETLHVRATGARWDDMRVVLTIRSPEGALLWIDTVGTTRWTGLDPDPDMTQAYEDSVIRDQLERFLADEAFKPTAGNFDDVNIDLRRRYAEELWHARHGTEIYADGSDSVYEQRVRSLDIPEEELERYEKEIMSRPMFRYYQGGESSVGITWSTMANKFVETWACC